MKKLWIAAIAAASTGCAQVPMIKADANGIKAVQGTSLTTVTYKKPDFTAMTAGKAAFGMFGAAAMIGAGNTIVKENQVADPADAIAATLASSLQTRLQSTSTNTVSGHESEARVAEAAGKKGAVLDVKTLNWMFGYFPTNWSHYRVMYSARARLLDGASGKVLGQVPCTYVSDEEATAPTYDQLLENQATLLKAKLAAAATACSEIIQKNLFNS